MVGAGHVAPRGALPAAQLVAIKVMDGGNGFCCTSDVVAALVQLGWNEASACQAVSSVTADAAEPDDEPPGVRDAPHSWRGRGARHWWVAR